MPRVAINGFGRIGRAALRIALQRELGYEVVAVNDVTDAQTLACLLANDSVYGPLAWPVDATEDGLDVDGQFVRVLREPDPERLPWDELEVDLVLECTGRLRSREAAAKHLTAGAQKVLVSAPLKGSAPADADIVLGVNDDRYDPAAHHVVTNASCTTNCLAPVAKVLHETVGIEEGLMTTVHAYTGDQALLDGPHKDLRRARAAALNLVPTTTGAAKAVGLVLPELDGRLDGLAVRAPVPTGSLVDLTIHASRATSVDAVNAAFADRAAGGPLEGILGYSEGPVVSSDIVGTSWSALFDAPLTHVRGRTVKVIAWYDNEWGYAHRLVELAERMAQTLPARV